MNQNSLIEIGSKANVIVRFKAETTLNGITYLANEPYLYLKECNVLINYTNQDKTSSTEVTYLANSNIKPRTVAIGGVSFSRKLAALLATYEQAALSYNPTLFKNLTADGTSIYLVDTIVDNEFLFVYDTSFNKVAGVTYVSASNSLTSVNFQDGETYLVSFSSVKTGTKFDMNKPCVPYMSLEIQGVGNIDKAKKEVLMYFDKVSLNSILQFTFVQDDMINVPLQFHIIEDVNNYVIFED